MEFFNKTRVVRLKSHLDKYLFAGDDGETVRQSRSGSSSRARWVVETVEGKSHAIRLRSCFRRYLSASEEPFLLGMTGKKVLQESPVSGAVTEWEPIREDAARVKLRARGGKFLRANGGTPPWRNHITHDAPHRAATQNWVLWEVEAVEPEELDGSSSAKIASPASSMSSILDDFEDFQGFEDRLSFHTSSASWRRQSGMELFSNAKSVRLRGHRDRYLLADDDGESVSQERSASSKRSRWTVEAVESSPDVLRLRSCYGRYLTATEIPFLLGVTGKKVLQTAPRKPDSSVEWEPLREGFQIRLKTRYGNFLRANGGLPPWRNSITHDIPHRTATQDWVLWDVEVVEVRSKDPKAPASDSSLRSASSSSSLVSESGKSSLLSVKTPRMSFKSPRLSKVESSDALVGSPMRDRGRDIYYSVAGGQEGEALLSFKGKGVGELKQRLEEATGLEDIIVCSCNPLNGKLCPLRLALPPNNTMHVVVVPASSRGAAKREIEIPRSPGNSAT